MTLTLLTLYFRGAHRIKSRQAVIPKGRIFCDDRATIEIFSGMQYLYLDHIGTLVTDLCS